VYVYDRQGRVALVVCPADDLYVEPDGSLTLVRDGVATPVALVEEEADDDEAEA